MMQNHSRCPNQHSSPMNLFPPPFRILLSLALVASILFFGSTGVLAGENLERGFASPPASAKPSVYWWWLYNRVDKKGITRNLQEFKAKGIGQVNLICTGGYAGDRAMPGVKFLGADPIASPMR